MTDKTRNNRHRSKKDNKLFDIMVFFVDNILPSVVLAIVILIAIVKGGVLG